MRHPKPMTWRYARQNIHGSWNKEVPPGEKIAYPLDKVGCILYNICVKIDTGVEEDSTRFASQHREPALVEARSAKTAKIPSELSGEIRVGKSMRQKVALTGFSPLAEKHMSVCTGGIMIVQAFILLLGMGAFLFLPENLVCTSGIII